MAQLSISHFFPQSFFVEGNFQKGLGEEFVLCENSSMVFHWADFHETCDDVKAMMENNPELQEDFNRRAEGLERLAMIPVWIRTQAKVYQTTMYELYEKHILKHSQLLNGLDLFGPIELSFISGTGPFKNMAIAECFNKTTYKDFVLVNLLKGNLPKRDFRIRLRSKILMEYGENFENAQLIQLEQLTSNGLLLSMDSDVFMKQVSSSKDIRILVDTEALQSAQGKNLEELKSHLSQFVFNLMYSSKKDDALECSRDLFSVQSSFEFLKTKKVYLFVSYDSLGTKGNDHVKRIQGFVEYTRNLVREHYRQRMVAKTA